MNGNKHYKLFADCIPVKGYTRSIIYDLSRGKYIFIPNELFYFFSDNKSSFRLNDIYKYLDVDKKNMNKYVDFLIHNELIFECQKRYSRMFPDIKLTYETPFLINNIVMEFDIDSNYYDKRYFFEQFDKLGCVDLQLKFFEPIPLIKIDTLLSTTLNRRINSIELVIPYNNNIVREIAPIIEKNNRLIRILVHSTPYEIIDELNISKNKLIPIYFVSDNITNSNYCGFVSPIFFTINLSFFTESKQFNNCLNKKLAIDTRGIVKNCTAIKESYGHINEINIEEIVKSKEFQKYWRITKDDIESCKDCEFRYMCSDCRAFTINNDILSKPLYCEYNPKTTKWDRKSRKKLYLG